MRSVVLLPHPEGPNRTRNSRSATSMLTSPNAVTSWPLALMEVSPTCRKLTLDKKGNRREQVGGAPEDAPAVTESRESVAFTTDSGRVTMPCSAGPSRRPRRDHPIPRRQVQRAGTLVLPSPTDGPPPLVSASLEATVPTLRVSSEAPPGAPIPEFGIPAGAGWIGRRAEVPNGSLSTQPTRDRAPASTAQTGTRRAETPLIFIEVAVGKRALTDLRRCSTRSPSR